MDFNKLLNTLKIEEGLRLFPYRDPKGILTIGYGHNLTANGITCEQALFFIQNDIGIISDTSKLGAPRLKPWTTPDGKTFIGYGRNLTDKGISYEEADRLLRDDLAGAVASARKFDWWQCVADNDARSRGMVELVFNMGTRTLGTFVNMLSAVRKLEWGTAKDELLDSRDVRLYSGIRKRYTRIGNMLVNGDG